MPYPNEHAARIHDPSRYVRFRRENNKFGDGIHAIWGITEDGTVELQSIRFDAKKYTVEEAKKWLKDHDIDYIEFEPASEEASLSIERRISEIRVADNKRKLTGYAAVFDKESEDLGGFVETIAPGAFSSVLAKNPDVRALINHDPNLVLGRTLAGTLLLREDEKGLLVEITLPDTQVARDLAVSIERGDVSQMSFAFGDVDDEVQKINGRFHRRILSIGRLYDVSVVTYPAYPDTSVALRRIDAWRAAKLKGAARKARERHLKPLLARLDFAISRARERGWIE